jgi:putative methyltransferase (TIGR04325 family)
MQHSGPDVNRDRTPSYARKLAMAGASAAARIPLLRAPLQMAYKHYFNRIHGSVRLFSGVYPDFKTAQRAIPADRLVGYDNPAGSRRNAHDLFRVFPMDYPILFWLSRLLPNCSLLFDWGGNIGISYFAFRKHLRYPPQLTWLVSDLPAVVAAGVATAADLNAPGLCFTTSLERLCEADILLAAGMLHFVEAPYDALRAQKELPRQVLLNKVPVYSLKSAVTLQNMGTALLPNHLFNEAEFTGVFKSLGYQLVDEWETQLGCHIPFHPEHSIHAYKGYYFAK